MQFVSNVNKFFDEKYHVVGLFLDLSKAFDSLNHEILLYKLSNIGIRGSPLHLFHSYINNRKQAVFCNSVYFTTKVISSGVPQGSVLGPILFLIYINDLVRCSSKLKFTIYADDTTLLMADKNLQTLHTNLCNEFGNVYQWTKHYRLKLNVNKTNYILFQNRSVRQCLPPVLLDGERIERVEHTKFLGVYIYEHLAWSQHIKKVCLKFSRTCGILYRIRKQLSTDAMLSIYYTLAYPFLHYCIAVWGCTWPSFLNKLVIAQKKVLTCILFIAQFNSTSNIFSTHNLLNVNSVHKYFLLLLIFKTIKKPDTHVFSLIDQQRITRENSANLRIPRFKTSLYKNSITCFGPRTWNSLPVDLKTLIFTGDYSIFKRKIKSYLFIRQNE